MSQHDEIRSLLPLEAAGDLEAGESRRVREHVAECEECRRARADFAELGAVLCSLPTPQPSAEILARVQASAKSRLVSKQTRGEGFAVLAPLVAASWIAAWITWPWVKAAGTWMLAGYHLPSGDVRTVLAVHAIIGFVLACAAAMAVGRQASAIRRNQ
jgi:predicted anti-sigma-YlaC factor YlaD